jgi:hypothetical protein
MERQEIIDEENDPIEENPIENEIHQPVNIDPVPEQQQQEQQQSDESDRVNTNDNREKKKISFYYLVSYMYNAY